MITCVVTYTIDPAKTREFEAFARAWMDLVGRRGGVHHGYFLPSEGASDEASATRAGSDARVALQKPASAPG